MPQATPAIGASFPFGSLEVKLHSLMQHAWQDGSWQSICLAYGGSQILSLASSIKGFQKDGDTKNQGCFVVTGLWLWLQCWFWLQWGPTSSVTASACYACKMFQFQPPASPAEGSQLDDGLKRPSPVRIDKWTNTLIQDKAA